MAYEQKDGGALWIATDRETGEVKLTSQGKKYYKGKFTLNGVTVNVTMFMNEDKKNPKGPDVTININKGIENAHAPQRATQERGANYSGGQEVQIDVMDIPF